MIDYNAQILRELGSLWFRDKVSSDYVNEVMFFLKQEPIVTQEGFEKIREKINLRAKAMREENSFESKTREQIGV